jgi:hypothetical protein
MQGNYTTRPGIQGTDCLATWRSVDQDLATRGEPKGERQDDGVKLTLEASWEACYRAGLVGWVLRLCSQGGGTVQ